MSVENRKRVYDNLVSAGRFTDISPQLELEFGSKPKGLATTPIKTKTIKKKVKK